MSEPVPANINSDVKTIVTLNNATFSPTSQCAICGGTDLHVLFQVMDTNEDVPGKWDIVVCEACGLGVLSPFPALETIASFYRDQFYNEKGQRFQGWMEALRSALGRLRGTTLNRFAPRRGKLIDFGSGAGHFARGQAAAGWDVLALDPYSNAATKDAHCKIVGETIELQFPTATFDAVTLWYVIEHLYNPRNIIAEFGRILKPGGILVLAQQDFSSIQAHFFGPRWLFLDPPRHLWQFSESNLTRLVNEEGFVVCGVERASLEMGPFTILQSTLNCLVGNGNYLFRFLKNPSLRMLSGIDHRGSKARLIASFLLLPIVAPLSLLAYFLLLLLKSGDVFTLYCRRQ